MMQNLTLSNAMEWLRSVLCLVKEVYKSVSLLMSYLCMSYWYIRLLIYCLVSQCTPANTHCKEWSIQH